MILERETKGNGNVKSGGRVNLRWLRKIVLLSQKLCQSRSPTFRMNNMTDELTEKLRFAFSERVDERGVVFILSKVRKLLERENLNSFGLLKRYTDWALHTKIERTSPMNEILTKIEQAVKSGSHSPETLYKISDFVDFRHELVSFLGLFGVQHRLNENVYWREFRKHLVETLIDCPLKPKSREITEFCFKRGTLDEISYEIHFKNHPRVIGRMSFPGF